MDIHEEAYNLVRGSRHDTYGPAAESFAITGRLWGALLRLDRNVLPSEVAMMMAIHKMTRETYWPQRDNRVDIIGYILLLDDIQKELDLGHAE